MTLQTSVFDFSPVEKRALVSIFKEDVKTSLKTVPFAVVLNFFTDCFDSSELKNVREASISKGEEAGKDEIYKYASVAHDPRVFVQLIEVLGKYDNSLANKLKCIGAHDLKHYQEILAQYYTINLLCCGVDAISSLAATCTSKGCLDGSAYATILDILQKPGAGGAASRDFRALAIFLKNLPRTHAEWYWLFMKALADIPNGLSLRDILNKNFDEDYQRHEYEKVAVQPAPLTVYDSETVLQSWLSKQPSYAGKTTATLNGDSGRGSMSESSSGSSLAGSGLKLRNYQIDLAAAAKRGQNAVICAPTGSGKTFVATDIIQNHFDTRRTGGKPKKVAFLVPTTQLVDQQHEVLKKHLASGLRIKKMKGGSASSASATIPKTEGAANNDIIVTTPQVLINIFRDKETTTPVSIFSFTLLVLDECHHTDKEHPYNEIMTQYLDIKIGNRDIALSLPQVACLTASLGVGKADDEKTALENVVHKLANMDAQALSTVIDEHRAELAEFVNVPVDRVEAVKHPPRPLTLLIEGVMAKIEKLVEADFNLLKPDIDVLTGASQQKASALPEKIPVTVEAPAQRCSPAYTGWLGTWLANIPRFKESPAKPNITSAFEHLRVYHITLDLNAHVPFEQALLYLTQRFDEFGRKQSSDRDRRLMNLYDQELMDKLKANPTVYAVKNPLVERLTQILLDEFRFKEDARVLVFVRTRDLTTALEEYMKNDPRLKPFNATRLTGAQASKDKGGQTMKEQQDLLERFRSGYHRILIATTVAEEGLDVEKCHLVIKYNHVTNEIAMVQRRGRGRAAGSESILLYQDDWIEEKEATNTLREFLMQKTINVIRRQGDTWLRGVIDAEQKKEYKDRNLKRKMEEMHRQSVAGKTYDMLCKKCDSFIISTKNMRRVAQCHYVAADPQIWDRLYAEPNNGRIFELMVQAGKVSCQVCRNDCGVILRIKHTYVPALKIAEMSLRDPLLGAKAARLVKKQWSKAVPAYFVVDELADSDLREMFDALNPATKNRLDHFIQIMQIMQREEDE